MLARRFCAPHSDYWHVFAADLRNEPHAMYWGAAPPGAPWVASTPQTCFVIGGGFGDFMDGDCTGEEYHDV